MSPIVLGLVGLGAVFAARPLCHASRFSGATMIGAGLFLAATPALARDETLLARDNSEVSCTVSKVGLTRISLKNDRFVSLSKMTRGVETDDFTVVHEPTRGDIYLSLPDSYGRPDVSFFGTSAKGFVYKFACRVAGDGAHQVFVENRDLVAAANATAGPSSRSEASIALIQAMYDGRAPDGFEFRQPDLGPVHVGRLKVRRIAEYRGSELSGRTLRIENDGSDEVALDETVIAPSNAVAVSFAQTRLKPGQATTAYIVLAEGAAR
jgi:conjugal transfer pilus assembly protein TraK